MKLIDLTGKKFGRLSVLYKLRMLGNVRQYWWCRCDCGEMRVVDGQRLRDGRSMSCGCLRRELSSQRNTKHGDTKMIDGKSLWTKEYRVWCNMKARCYRPYVMGYKNYGGRGIRVCKRWRDSYLNFLEDMGRAPSSKHSIDRIDNDGHYTPKNCQWATGKQQRANQRIGKAVG